MTIAWNQDRWGTRAGWAADNWGYAYAQPGRTDIDYTGVSRLADQYLRPWLQGQRPAVLEVAPGAGRFTVELLRYADTLHMLDLNAVCLDICRERFSWYNHITYWQNDGTDCAMLPDAHFDLVASYDSLVHAEPEVIRAYLVNLRPKLRPGAILWLDHSNGACSRGYRSAMTAALMQEFAAAAGYRVLAQYWYDDRDCISVLQEPTRCK